MNIVQPTKSQCLFNACYFVENPRCKISGADWIQFRIFAVVSASGLPVPPPMHDTRWCHATNIVCQEEIGERGKLSGMQSALFCNTCEAYDALCWRLYAVDKYKITHPIRYWKGFGHILSSKSGFHIAWVKALKNRAQKILSSHWYWGYQ